jgi:AcrR family transcriptional regulator
MGRPREHNIESILDRATTIMVERGVHGLTLRELATETGASNGTIYHAFGSRSGLVAMAYLQNAERFLALQRDAVEQARLTTDDAAAPVVAAAQAASRLAGTAPVSAAFLMLVRYDELLVDDIPDDLRESLSDLARRLSILFVDLARTALGRDDELAVDTIRTCVVDVPSGLLLRREQLTDPHALLRVEAAVRGILAAAPPSD